jgi:hypothetical protein
MTFPTALEGLSQVEFLEWANQDKIRLIDWLASQLLVVGEECAVKTAEYHRAKANAKLTPEIAQNRYLVEIRYDYLKHAISALQSTLKAETKI